MIEQRMMTLAVVCDYCGKRIQIKPTAYAEAIMLGECAGLHKLAYRPKDAEYPVSRVVCESKKCGLMFANEMAAAVQGEGE